MLLKDINTLNGKLYALGFLLALFSFIFAIIDSINTLDNKDKKVSPILFISFFLLSVSCFVKAPYIYTKTLSFINLMIMGVGYLTPAIIYLIAYTKQ